MNLLTYADSNYLLKLLAFYTSLVKYNPQVRLYVLALDEEVRQAFVRKKQISVITLNQFMDDELRIAKTNRSRVEWLWTVASSLLYYGLTSLNLDCTYVDADTFVTNPINSFSEEIGVADVALVPHRFAPQDEERLLPNGKFNVSWVYAKNSEVGKAFAREWRELCLEWCYYKNEPDRFGDQKYLDNLSTKYDAHAVRSLGHNLGPWSQGQFQYRYDGKNLLISDGKREDPLVSFHTHELQHTPDGHILKRTGWQVHPMIAEHIYVPYQKLLLTLGGNNGIKTT